MSLDIVLVDNFEEHIHDLLLDVLPQGHKLAVNAVKDCLQVVTLARILTIKELQEATYEVMRNVLNDHILAEMHSQDKLKKKLVDKLQVGPCLLKMWLIFIRVHICRFLVVYHIIQNNAP